MERKINEIYNKEGREIRCVEAKKDRCLHCVYSYDAGNSIRCFADEDIDGECVDKRRTDKKDVFFVDNDDNDL